MAEFDPNGQVSIEVASVDEHLIELAAFVRTGYWQGRATAYTVISDVTRFADALLRFADGESSATFEAGADTGIGLIALRFHRIDRSGHIACHVRLVRSVPTHHRPEEVSRLEVEFNTEAWAVIRLAQQLAELARTQAGKALLTLESET